MEPVRNTEEKKVLNPTAHFGVKLENTEEVYESQPISPRSKYVYSGKNQHRVWISSGSFR